MNQSRLADSSDYELFPETSYILTDASTFMTLCNVSGGSVKNEELDMIMKATGFQKATADKDMQPGKEYKEESHCKFMLNFISTQSMQRGEEDFDGWKFTCNKNYPDLWIHPGDSVVLTIHGRELVQVGRSVVTICLDIQSSPQVRAW
jgi:hypothetical protein